MRIARVDTWTKRVELTRPYAIALKSTDAVDLVLVRVEADDGTVGLGSATPEPVITGETLAACEEALAPTALRWLLGRNAEDWQDLALEARQRSPASPGARAALDMAVHDLRAKGMGLPLVDALGRVHDELPTSVTIGIRSVADTLTEADEYVGRGFRCLKVKIGKSVAADVERLARLRERCGDDVAIRVDANQGYSLDELRRFSEGTSGLGLELVEQPLPPADDGALGRLPASARRLLAADESVMDERDAVALARRPASYGTFVIKLMKCGGIGPALSIASVAGAAGIDLMWGCMDESVIGISAALHAAFACPRTRFLDLDGSLDLAEDVAAGGFTLEDGVMRTLDRPGLGVELVDAR